MFRPARRTVRATTTEQAWALVSRASHGVLSMIGDDGYPYGIPMTHWVQDGTVFFHCGLKGHKMDSLQRCGKVCFTVVEGPHEAPDDIPPYTLGTHESAVLFGQITLAPQEETVVHLQRLLSRHTPGREDGEQYISQYIPAVAILKMTVDHITGKKLLVK